MSGHTRAALGIWRDRSTRSISDRSFIAYMAVMVSLVAVAPVGRAVWLSAVSPGAVALFTHPAAPGVTALVVALLWAGALLLGRDRGPVLLPPFLTYALGSSERPQAEAFGAPFWRSAALVTVLCTASAALVGASLLTAGAADAAATALFVVAGAAVGLVASVLWLAGQVFPRRAVPAALIVLAAGALAAAVPAVLPFVPWGWVALAYPTGVVVASGTVVASVGVVAFVAVAAAAVSVTPWLLSRLHLDELATQAARWQTATTHAAGLDIGGAAATYRARPHLGRRLRAVRPRGPLAVTFLVRDAVGSLRTPGRLIVGALALAAGATLLVLALSSGTPGWLFGAAAGLLLVAGLGAFSDGIGHAAVVASDFPLYGISDGGLLARHALYPLIVVTVIVVTVALVVALLAGLPPVGPVAAALAVAPLTLLVRIVNALKGPLPPILLTPVPTAMGDPMAAVRLVWALDGVIFAALIGCCAALTLEAPLLLGALAVTLAATGLHRWRHRR